MKKKIFKLLVDYKISNPELFNALVGLTNDIVNDTTGACDEEFYGVLIRLSNSENNANWESRHSQRLNIIRETIEVICERSEDYLP